MPTLLFELPLQTAQTRPDAVAVHHGGHTTTYAELGAGIERVAAGFLGLGLQRADRVGVYLPKQLEAVVAMFAAPRAGGVFVPINHVLRPAQVGHILRDCDVSILVTTRARLATLKDELSTSPAIRSIVLVDDADGTGDARVVAYASLPDAGGRTPHRTIDTDMVSILYTSGSTGKPKGVVLSHRNMVTGAKSVASYLANEPGDRLLAVLPFSFDYGFSQLSTAFSVGASVSLLDYLVPRDVLRALEAGQITGLAGVPPLWAQLADLDWPAGSTAHLRYLTNSGGAVPRAMSDKLRARAPGAKIFLMYGLTEAFRSTFLPPAELDRRPDSIGKAIPGAEILVLRPDGTECDAEEPGELVHRGSLVGMGYWNDPAKTAERYKPILARQSGLVLQELAVWSGDTVRRDAEGFLYFVGRRDEMLKTSGYRVSPTEVEEVAYGTGLVADAVAVGVPHARLGHAIVLVASPPPGKDVTSDELLRALRDVLPGYMVPSAIEWRTELPRNPNGKFDRASLTREVAGLYPITT
ncbi:MAG: acyl-CoA ligase (AMP-forming), exosortase A system-associated [Polyangia bacterium]